MRFKRLNPVRGEPADLVLVGKLIDEHSALLERLDDRVRIHIEYPDRPARSLMGLLNPEVLNREEEDE